MTCRTIVEKTDDYYLCRFQLKGDFWLVGRLALLDRDPPSILRG